MIMADRVGFEPTVPFSTSVFKTDAIDHSTTYPVVFMERGVYLSLRELPGYDLNVQCFREKLTASWLYQFAYQGI